MASTPIIGFILDVGRADRNRGAFRKVIVDQPHRRSRGGAAQYEADARVESDHVILPDHD